MTECIWGAIALAVVNAIVRLVYVVACARYARRFGDGLVLMNAARAVEREGFPWRTRVRRGDQHTPSPDSLSSTTLGPGRTSSLSEMIMPIGGASGDALARAAHQAGLGSLTGERRARCSSQPRTRRQETGSRAVKLPGGE
jgi:hypothetical protein